MQNYGFNYGLNGAGYNPYAPQFQNQARANALKILPVSNIMEANATPVNDLEPVFFFNRAENVIYKKQIDSTGAAPIQTFKLDLLEKEEVKKPFEEDFKAINERLDELVTLIKPIDKEAKK